MAKVNPWMVHLKKFRAAHPGMNNKLIFSAAKKTYKKQHGGGGALGGSLTPSPISGTTALQGKASLYSGGKRCSRRRHSSRRRSSKRQ